MKKFIALFLVFSLLALSGNLIAKERRGAEIVIQKKDGQQVKGELIAVKKDSLLLLERESGADVTVDIGDVSVITIVKKSKFKLGAGLGLLVGASGGALAPLGLNMVFNVKPDSPVLKLSLKYALIFGVIGLASGTLLGGLAGQDKTIQIEGKSDSEIKEVLERLRKKARVTNFQ